MNLIEESIENKEKELMIYIENKIIESIQMFCQWKLHLTLVDNIIEKEAETIKSKILPQLNEDIKKLAPLHFMYMYYSPLCSLFNDSCVKSYNQRDCLRWNSEFKHSLCYFSTITYKDFEAAGFSQDFAKRVVKKYIDLDVLRQRKGIRGYKYSLTWPERLKDRIKYLKKGIRIDQNGYEFIHSEDWIYGKFSEDVLENTFDHIKDQILAKIGKGIALEDEEQNL